MHLKIFILLVLLVLFSCGNEKEEKSGENLAPNIHKVLVNEVEQANVYTYLLVNENGQEYWMAIAKKEVEEGDVLYYTKSLEMKNFESKDLDKKFDKIYFVDKISERPEQMSTLVTKNNPHGQVRLPKKSDISVTPVEDGITIEKLYSDKDQYSGAQIKIRGQVVKFTPQIMGKNWVHIQDGTSYDKNFELTITTQDMVKRGDIVTFEGEITLNKDIGAGYAYELLMENGKILEKSVQN